MRGHSPIFRLSTTLAAVFIALLLLLPLLSLLLFADPLRQLRLLQHPATLSALRVTLETSVAATIIIFLAGLPTAYALSRAGRRTRQLVDSLLELPMVLPPIVAGLALLLAFGRNGSFGRYLNGWGIQVPFSATAVVLAIVFSLSPFFIRRVTGLFDQIDHELEEAAELLGGSPFHCFVHVTLPLCRRQLSAEAIMVFLQSIGLFGAVILFAGNIPGRTRTLTLAIFDAFESNPDAAFALAALLMVLSMLLLLTGRLLFGGAGKGGEK